MRSRMDDTPIVMLNEVKHLARNFEKQNHFGRVRAGVNRADAGRLCAFVACEIIRRAN